MAIIKSRIMIYAQGAILYGQITIEDIKPEYIQPVKEYAAATFTLTQMNEALYAKRIPQEWYDEIVAMMPPKTSSMSETEGS